MKNKEHNDMMIHENQWNQQFQGKNLGMIWPSYP